MQVSAVISETVYPSCRARGICRGYFGIRRNRHVLPEITSVLLFVAVLAAPLSLQACNTTAGIGKDVSAGANAMTKSAEKNKGY